VEKVASDVYAFLEKIGFKRWIHRPCACVKLPFFLFLIF
jgi:hypothetical protein